MQRPYFNHDCMCIVLYVDVHTVYVRIEAQASISFRSFLTRPLFEPSFC